MTNQDEGLWADWQELIADANVEQFVASGFMMLNHVFTPDFCNQLLNEAQQLSLSPAKLTYGERLNNIRGDSTYWLDESLTVGKIYLENINMLAKYLNQLFYAGIQRVEAHYACYPPNSGYDWHQDNPKGRDERVISAVFYLNADWQASDGGCLELIDIKGKAHTIHPVMGNMVIFDSNLQHRVQPAYASRYSIATWLRKDAGIFDA